MGLQCVVLAISMVAVSQCYRVDSDKIAVAPVDVVDLGRDDIGLAMTAGPVIMDVDNDIGYILPLSGPGEAKSVYSNKRTLFGKRPLEGSRVGHGYGKRVGFKSASMGHGFGKRSAFKSRMGHGFGKRRFSSGFQKGFAKRPWRGDNYLGAGRTQMDAMEAAAREWLSALRNRDMQKRTLKDFRARNVAPSSSAYLVGLMKKGFMKGGMGHGFGRRRRRRNSGENSVQQSDANGVGLHYGASGYMRNIWD